MSDASPLAPGLSAAHEAPDRNLALELVRVTEAAALAAARWVGKGEKESADQAAVDAMRLLLDTVPMDGVVVIGEGEKDEAPMLYNGERIGDASPPEVDIAVDPLEGTTLTARGMPSALSVIALAERGTMFDPGPCVYMEKLAGGPEIADLLSLDDPLEEVVGRVAERRGVGPGDITLIVLDRPRHQEMVDRLREIGARVRFISDGDVSAALFAVSAETGGVDLLWGIGGTPEGVLSAAAIKCLGGQLLGRLWPRDDDERRAAIDAGYDLDEVLDVDRLVSGQDVFFAATGVTDGELLHGVRVRGGKATTESLVMRSRSGTVRTVSARHDQAKLREITGGRYG
jgi:fructose-1,6-bisphosphatase II